MIVNFHFRYYSQLLTFIFVDYFHLHVISFPPSASQVPSFSQGIKKQLIQTAHQNAESFVNQLFLPVYVSGKRCYDQCFPSTPNIN